MRTTESQIDNALRHISPDIDREQWARMLMAVKHGLGEDGRDIADQWSQGSDRYDPAGFRDTWRSIKADRGITVASLFHTAKANGWRTDATTHAPLKPPHAPAARVQAAPVESSTLPYARAIWQRVRRDDAYVADHPYAIRKHIKHAAGAGRTTASGKLIGQNADCIVVPMRTYPCEQLCGVECINADGIKQTFGSKGVLILGNDLDPKLMQFVVEGWATGAAHVFGIYEGNACCYVAFGKGRQMQVAEAVSEAHPKRDVVICAEATA